MNAPNDGAESGADNGAVAREALHVVWSSGDVDRIPEFYTDDYVIHIPRPLLNWMGAPVGLNATGHAFLRDAVESIRAAFPDYTETPELVVSEGDMVAVRIRNTGTNTGVALDGTPPTGRGFDIVDTMFVRFERGRIAEQWGLLDEFRVGVQLGVIPADGLPLIG